MNERNHRLPVSRRQEHRPRAGDGALPASHEHAPPARPAPPPPTLASGGTDLIWLWRALRRRWWVILLVFVGLTGGVYGLLKLRTPQFTASTEIVIEQDETEFANLRESLDFRQRDIDPAAMETYLRVLGSDRVALAVIERLGLEPEVGTPKPWTPVAEWLGENVSRLVAQAQALAGTPASRETVAPARAPAVPSRPGAAEAERPVDPEELMLTEFRNRLKITRDPLAHVITVAYTAPDPSRAAEVANTLAQIFLEELVRAQKVMLAQTADYLRDRVKVLRDELAAAERSSKTYQSQRELYQVQGGSTAELRYAELMRELSVAESELGRARARQSQVGARGDSLAGITEDLSSPVISDLRRQEAELGRRVADLRSSFGEKHPLMVNAKNELDSIRQSIRREQSRIAAQVQGELRVAEERVKALKGRLAEAEQKLTRTTGAQVQLKELESRADTTRKMYEDMLGRYQRATEQQHLLRPMARVISPARPPSDPDSKKNMLILGFAAFSSLAGGMGFALLLELMRRGYETADEIEAHTGVPVLGVLPLVSRRSKKDRVDEGKDLPAIVYTEAIQRLAVRLVPAIRHDGMGEVVLVTSSLPDEGKTTVALSLARQMAATGLEVVLIDADLRKRSLESRLGVPGDARPSLPDLLTDERVTLEDVLVRDDRTGLDFLLAGQASSQPLRLLGSPAMARLLEELRDRYDVILIDTPPVLAVSDYAVLAPLVDHLLFVIRWRITARRATRTALKELAALDAPLTGIALNQVRLGTYRRRAGGDSISYYKATARYYRAGAR